MRSRRAFFDVWSRFYDLAAVQRAVYRPVHRAVLAELFAHPRSRVLDVGCGTGILSERVARELGATVVGCDFSFGMLEQAVARTRGVCWVQGDALHLPVGDATVDAVLSTSSFHWFPDQDAALREFERVLVPRGRLLVALLNVRARVTSRAAQAGARVFGEPAYWPTRTEMRERVAAAGFDVLAQRRIMRVAGMLIPTVLTVAAKRGR